MKCLRILPDPLPWPAAALLDRTWPSRVDLKHEPIDLITECLASAHAITEEDRPWLVLCLDEAIVNAMLHGNEGDPSLNVRIAVAVADGRWSVLVADQGHGFTHAAIPDPEDPSSLLLEHGRGIRIMNEWLDELTYFQGGSAVLMARRCSRPAGD
jgi:serine/threonine-protein kinase RsbW